jgi:hypothetical protein
MGPRDEANVVMLERQKKRRFVWSEAGREK